VLAEFDALEYPFEGHAPLAGRLSVTAPVLFGQLHVAPVVREFLKQHPALDVRLVLLDRVVSLAEEGLDLGVRLGPLPDSALRARLLGHVRSVLCASPAYLKAAGIPRSPEALSKHVCIAFTGATPIADRWAFPGPSGRERSVAARARLVVNTGQAAIDAALDGLGIVRVLSYQIARQVTEKKLRVFLESFEPPPLPIHLVQLPGVQNRAASAFVDYFAARLRSRLKPSGSAR
jgi:DNA-binding transcriptional LysR family regulator